MVHPNTLLFRDIKLHHANVHAPPARFKFFCVSLFDPRMPPIRQHSKPHPNMLHSWEGGQHSGPLPLWHGMLSTSRRIHDVKQQHAAKLRRSTRIPSWQTCCNTFCTFHVPAFCIDISFYFGSQYRQLYVYCAATNNTGYMYSTTSIV